MNRTDVSVVGLTIIFSFRILHTVSLEKMADKYLIYIENESIVDKVELFESMLQQSMLFSVYLIRWIIRTWSINICTLFSGTEGLIQPDEDLCRQASILWWCQDITPATTALLWRDRAYLPKNKCSPQVGSEQSQPPPAKVEYDRTDYQLKQRRDRKGIWVKAWNAATAEAMKILVQVEHGKLKTKRWGSGSQSFERKGRLERQSPTCLFCSKHRAVD